MDDTITITGLLYPFVREADDFSVGAGATLLKSNVRKVVATKAASQDGRYRGEYPWRLDFGSDLDRIRHSNYDEFMTSLLQIYFTDAVSLWEPRASVSTERITFSERDGGHLMLASVGSQSDGSEVSAQLEVPL